MTATPRPKVYLKDFTISTGLLSVRGNIFTPSKPNAKAAESFKMACPLHPGTPHGVKQKYACINDPEGSTVDPGDCLSARVVDDKFVLVSKDDKKSAKKSDLEKGRLDLRAHPYSESTTFALGNAYVFQPAGAEKFYATLLEAVDAAGVVQTDDGPIMLVGMVAFREGTESFVRLERWGNQLVIRELLRPEDVQAFPNLDSSVDTKDLNVFRMLMAATSEEFDPTDYKSAARERIALLTQSTSGTVAVVAPVKSVTADYSALLEQSLAAIKAKKEKSQ